jgi:5-methyltetrahydrofolate--homocysteine methyltransferase
VANLLDILKKKVLVCDGAMGTQLIAAGLQPGECAEEWNVSRRDAVRRIQRAYIEAGADLVLTNTFGANRLALERHGLHERLAEFNAAAVENARVAAGRGGFVLGDIGPTGAFPESLGGCGEDEFRDIFLEQAEALAAAGVDAFIIETMTSVEEMRGAVRAARKAAELPVIASAAYDPTPQGTVFRTMMGADVEQMTHAALKAGADVVGANCGGVNMRDMVAVAGIIRGITPKSILIEANAGRPEVVGGATVYPETPAEFAAHVGELLKLGVRIVGGCCGTTPDHIRAIAKIVKGA